MLMPKHKLKLVVIVVAVAALFHVSSRTFLGQNAVDSFLLFVIPRLDEPAAPTSREELQEAKERVRILEQENALLRQDRELLSAVPSARLFASILWYDPALFVERVRVNLGIEEGVRKGAAVTAPGELLVGRVIAARPHTAEVELATSPTFGGVSVVVGDAVGLATPTAAGFFTVQFVNKDDVPEPGSQVRTAGRGDQLPRGLLLGYTAEAEITPKDPFAHITVVPAVSAQELSFVFISSFSP